MFFRIFEHFEKHIKDYKIFENDSFGSFFRLRGEITFLSNDTLHFRIIILDGKSLKYSFHWADARKSLLCRWDNAPHWPQFPSFPHHKHKEKEGNVVDSPEAGDFFKIMSIICSHYER